MKFLFALLIILLFVSCGQNYHISENNTSLGSVVPVQPSPPPATPSPTPTPPVGLCSDVATASPTIVTGAGTAADPYIVCNIDQLQSVNNDLTAYYELGQDIDASVTST